jgi:hypothetical protein
MNIRRATTALAVALSIGSVAASSAAAAEPTNWSVKGKPLAAGESRSVKIKSSGPIKVLVQGGGSTGLAIVCKKSQGAGVIEGAKDSSSFGTGRLTQLSFSKCGVEGEPGCEVTAKFKFEIKVETDGELLHPSTWTVKWEIKLNLNARARPKMTCAISGEHELAGSADSNGPHNQEIEFPQPPLTSSALQFDGRPAAFVGKYKLKAKGGTLSFG